MLSHALKILRITPKYIIPRCVLLVHDIGRIRRHHPPVPLRVRTLCMFYCWVLQRVSYGVSFLLLLQSAPGTANSVRGQSHGAAKAGLLAFEGDRAKMMHCGGEGYESCFSHDHYVDT